MLRGPFHGADRALLAQLALRGRMVQLEEPLVEMREHPQRYTRRQRSGAARQAWHEATATRRPIPSLELYRTYRRLVATEPLTDAERRACRRVVARWWLLNWNALRVAADLVDSVAPGFVGWAERVKIHFFGAAPGHFLDDVEGPPRPPARGSVRS